VYDAYYNGTFFLTLEPVATNLSECYVLSSHTISDAYFRIGPQARNGLSRAEYDSNPFYFAFGQTYRSTQCPQVYNNLYASLESSNDLLVYGQPWEVSAVKNGNDNFELTGSVTSPRASYDNYYNFLVNTTESEFQNYTDTCPIYFSKRTITSDNNLTMTGIVDALEATLSWSFTDFDVGYTVTGSFSGVWWTKGAKLDFSSATITTTGQSKRVSINPKSFAQQNVKWIVLGCLLSAFIVLLVCIWCCCSTIFTRLCRCSSAFNRLRNSRKKKSSNQPYIKASTIDDSSAEHHSMHLNPENPEDPEQQTLDHKNSQSPDDTAGHSRAPSPISSQISASPTPEWSPLLPV
jgi:hypothetical protein